jgi:hypothetical protein
MLSFIQVGKAAKLAGRARLFRILVFLPLLLILTFPFQLCDLPLHLENE